ncbi:MAG: M55 family metallopeptidase [candidate division Zixibacteria bacterium]
MKIYVQDAHDSGRNLLQSKLPERVRLIREWSGHPYAMLQGLDKSFDAVMMTGYHSRAGADGNPLAHTFSGQVAYLKINDRYTSEFLINAYTAAHVGVPVVMVTGDANLCKDVNDFNPNIATIPVNEGAGGSVISIHPSLAIRRIEDAARDALNGDLGICKIELPAKFTVELGYRDYKRAYRASFFPGVELIKPQVVRFENDNYYEVLRMLMFTW